MENGEYQLYVEEMEPYGKGKYFIELEKLKKKLEAEGLFAMERKSRFLLILKRLGSLPRKTQRPLQILKRISIIVSL